MERKGNKKDRTILGEVSLYCRLGRRCWLGLWELTFALGFFDVIWGLHQFGFRRGQGADDALQITRRLANQSALDRGQISTND